LCGNDNTEAVFLNTAALVGDTEGAFFKGDDPGTEYSAFGDGADCLDGVHDICDNLEKLLFGVEGATRMSDCWEAREISWVLCSSDSREIPAGPLLLVISKVDVDNDAETPKRSSSGTVNMWPFVNDPALSLVLLGLSEREKSKSKDGFGFNNSNGETGRGAGEGERDLDLGCCEGVAEGEGEVERDCEGECDGEPKGVDRMGGNFGMCDGVMVFDFEDPLVVASLLEGILVRTLQSELKERLPLDLPLSGVRVIEKSGGASSKSSNNSLTYSGNSIFSSARSLLRSRESRDGRTGLNMVAVPDPFPREVNGGLKTSSSSKSTNPGQSLLLSSSLAFPFPVPSAWSLTLWMDTGVLSMSISSTSSMGGNGPENNVTGVSKSNDAVAEEGECEAEDGEGLIEGLLSAFSMFSTVWASSWGSWSADADVDTVVSNSPPRLVSAEAEADLKCPNPPGKFPYPFFNPSTTALEISSSGLTLSFIGPTSFIVILFGFIL
jgi:hypothetical protein